MLLLAVSVSAALLLPVSISAIPLSSRALSQAGVANAYLSASQVNSTDPSPDLNPSTQTVTCFAPKAGLDLTAVARDCAIILNNIIFRLDGLFENRAFSRQHYMNSNGRWVPSRWVWGQCKIYARSAQSDSVDIFSLFEVALAANKILVDCVTSHREGQGGTMPVGSSERSYYVGLQGHSSDGKVNAIDDAELSALPHFKAVKRALDTKRAFRGPTGLQPRFFDLQVASVSLSEALRPSNPTRNLKADGDIDCFPRGSRLPNANVDDCNFIINSIIIGMKDPFRPQTWGYTDIADINLTLPKYRWTFNDCFIRVKNIDEKQVDRFRPVDVAEVAQSIVQRCVVETKERLGGNADVGQLGFPRSFYVVVSGTARRISWKSQRNDTVPSLPSGGSQTLESRASPISPEENPVSLIHTEGLTAGRKHPVNCFSPKGVRILKPATASDCSFIINEIILRLPNPMKEQNFGYTDAVDIDVSKAENNHWIYGRCAVFLRNFGEKTDVRDRFRFVDVAFAAHRIMEQCVEGSKYAIGGVADVGRFEDRFYVGVSGIDPDDPGNGRTLDLASGVGVSSAMSALLSKNSTDSTLSHGNSGTESANLVKRSSNITKLGEASNRFARTANCIRSGMPAAKKIDMQDCTDAAMVLLSDPKILVPQPFTTEQTGGIKMPFVQNNRSCYLMMDTKLDRSISETIPLLKMVYWALEIMLKCISGREEGFGGVSMLDRDKGIFVSVTGMDPRAVGFGLANLLDENTLAIVNVGDS